jgi:DNA-binding transcriptional MerR regulator
MIQTKTTPVDSQAPHYRIGAVAKLSGVPVTTLRVWEIRYAAFTPSKSDGQHRLYSQADVLKAGQLKQLSDAGHGISAIAHLDTASLRRLLLQQHPTATATAMVGEPVPPGGRKVAMAVVGRAMASRVTAPQFTLQFLTHSIEVSDVFEDLAHAAQAASSEQPQILLIKVSTLNDNTRAQIENLVARQRILQTIVIYNYGQLVAVEALKVSGLLVRREPLSDPELSDLISSVLLVDAASSVGAFNPTALIPARKYSDATLRRVAGISTNVLCECPRHVAELIGQLANFEQYSQECLNNSTKDAHLHAYLRAVSGSARAMFERALEIVAVHEGISLAEAAPGVVKAPFPPKG